MRLEVITFEAHEYTVMCEKCGSTQINNDSGVITECKLLKVSRCLQCSPDSVVVPIQIPFTDSGERIYV